MTESEASNDGVRSAIIRPISSQLLLPGKSCLTTSTNEVCQHAIMIYTSLQPYMLGFYGNCYRQHQDMLSEQWINGQQQGYNMAVISGSIHRIDSIITWQGSWRLPMGSVLSINRKHYYLYYKGFDKTNLVIIDCCKNKRKQHKVPMLI